MIIAKVIENVKRKKEGYDISDAQIIESISRIEGEIVEDVMKGREGEEAADGFAGYDADTDRNTELIAPAPYDRIYEEFAAAQIDMLYEDAQRYEMSAGAFNETLRELRRTWWRDHRQKRNYNYYK